MPGNPLTDPHWPAEIADTVERLVGKVRDLTTKNLVLAARALVFGILAAVLGVVALVVLLIGLSRGLQSLLDLFLPRERAVYVSYLVLGGMWCLLGAFLMAKRRPRDA